MTNQTVGVIGAGVMGTGVAQCLSQAGHQVILRDLGPGPLEAARRGIVDGVRLQRLLGRKGAAVDVDDVLSRIAFAADDDRLAEVDFAIENVPERWEIKRPVWQRLDEVCPERTIFAANTSAIPITLIASATRRPASVLGIHFMNPVPQKPMVELVRGQHTSEAALDAARALLASMNKTSVLVNDAPGFVSNRVLMLTINEAAFLVHEGVASAADVDKIFKGCFEHKMGPLETADMIGLDTILQSIEVLHDSFRDDKYRPCPLLQRMVADGLLGRKSGRGFHTYS